ncbi:hypothetical protein Cgig2_017220 [Carnegiea gigantea]|uniref:Uncharacterized protein n=1 Tax=Carnegiea gigantea TaxID=171969 RepID=A0A9Q1KHA4_9CARY|nr:hypothetical protein Cgig2_017220 [Carnegiea gigantea]
MNLSLQNLLLTVRVRTVFFVSCCDFFEFSVFVRGEAGLEIGVLGNGRYVTVKVSRELGGGRVENPTLVDDYKQIGNNRITYMGGSKKCIEVKERMELEELRGGVDVRIVFKGNDEHGYLYVGGNHVLKRQAQKAGASCERQTYTYDHGVVYTISGRNGTTDIIGCLLRTLLMSTSSNLDAGKYCSGHLPCSPNGSDKLTLVNRAFKRVNPLVVQKLVPLL